MSTPVEELIKEIAAAHAISVGRDDPIMILHTINKRLLLDSYNVQQELLKRFEENLEASAQRWGEDSKARAERILNTALTASCQIMEEAAAAGTRVAGEAVHRELKMAVNRMADAANNLRWLLMANFLTSITAIGALMLVSGEKF